MPFEKGRAKTGGREAGTPNKALKALREQLQEIVQASLDELPDTLAAMEPTDRLRALTALLPYVMPKLSSVELASTDERQGPVINIIRPPRAHLTVEELEAIIADGKQSKEGTAKAFCLPDNGREDIVQ